MTRAHRHEQDRFIDVELYGTHNVAKPLQGAWFRAKKDPADGMYIVGKLVRKGDSLENILWEDVTSWGFMLTSTNKLPSEVINDPAVILLAKTSFEDLPK